MKNLFRGDPLKGFRLVIGQYASIKEDGSVVIPWSFRYPEAVAVSVDDEDGNKE